jgi:hypothetical protein
MHSGDGRTFVEVADEASARSPAGWAEGRAVARGVRRGRLGTLVGLGDDDKPLAGPPLDGEEGRTWTDADISRGTRSWRWSTSSSSPFSGTKRSAGLPNTRGELAQADAGRGPVLPEGRSTL